jgi:hypothetical protein
MRVVLHRAGNARSVAWKCHGKLDVEVFEGVQAIAPFHRLHASEGSMLGSGQSCSRFGGSSEHRKQLHQHWRSCSLFSTRRFLFFCPRIPYRVASEAMRAKPPHSLHLETGSTSPNLINFTLIHQLHPPGSIAIASAARRSVCSFRCCDRSPTPPRRAGGRGSKAFLGSK